jgi:hypothetical protein
MNNSYSESINPKLLRIRAFCSASIVRDPHLVQVKMMRCAHDVNNHHVRRMKRLKVPEEK